MSKKNLKPNVKRARTCIYNCNYHIFFSSEYRRKVLTAEVEKYIKKVLQEIAEEKGFEITMVKVGEQDHIHIFASAHPKIAPSCIVKMIKGITARKLFLKFPQLKKKLLKGHLWNPSYYIETIGSISGKSIDLSDYKEQDVIKKYIENQKKI